MCERCEILSEMLTEAGQKVALCMEKMDHICTEIHRLQNDLEATGEIEDSEARALHAELHNLAAESSMAISRLATVSGQCLQAEPVAILRQVTEAMEITAALGMLESLFGEDTLRRLLGGDQ